MPKMYVLQDIERASNTRWETVIGKSIKDLTTRIMKQEGTPRLEARKIAFDIINRLCTETK